MSTNRTILGAALAATLAGCADPGAQTATQTTQVPDKPEAMVRSVIKKLDAGDPSVLWAALPASYQRDLTLLVHGFAAKLDAESYDAVFTIAKRIVNLLDTKKEFLLNYPTLAMFVRDKSKLDAHWSSFVGLLRTVTDSEISTAAGLQKLDVAAFLAGTGGKFMRQMKVLSAMSPGSPLSKLAETTVELVSTNGDEAAVRVTQPERRAQTLKLTKVEGKWVPSKMARDFAKTMKRAHDELAEMSPQQAGAATKMGLAMAEAFVTQLEQIDSQEEFNELLDGLMQQAMSPRRGPGAAPQRR